MTSILEKLYELVPVSASSIGTQELERILALPMRPPEPLDESVYIQVNNAFSVLNPNCRCAEWGRVCIQRLKPVQAWALYELYRYSGLLAPIGVGQGKTGLDILAALAVPNVRIAVLFVPPSLVEQLRHDYLAWREHFRVPGMVFQFAGRKKGWIITGAPTVHVVPYSRLSRPEATELLEKLRPDLIIADEAHRLRHPDTATTSRVLRYMQAHPETRFASWSGSLTDKSIRDYAHLAAFALREGSPLPLHRDVIEEWALVIDPSDWPKPPGELIRLCRPGENIHEGFKRRLLHTPGVVSTSSTGDATNASIYLLERKPKGGVPDNIHAALAEVRETWTRPDGEEFVDALTLHRCLRELACGFYYRWIFPRGESRELILEWLEARKEWHRELREKLKHREPHLDSPHLCTNAARRYYEGGDPNLPRWKALTWRRWEAVRELVQPATEAVWVSDYLAQDAAVWAKKHRGVVWYDKRAFGERVAELSGLPLHGGGPDATKRIRAEKGDRSIVASIKAHGTGRDGLQYHFSEQLVANPPSTAAEWEQLLGRLHRIGQTADEIHTYVYRHTPELADAVATATARGAYIEGTMGNVQKLLLATRDWE